MADEQFEAPVQEDLFSLSTVRSKESLKALSATNADSLMDENFDVLKAAEEEGKNEKSALKMYE